MELHDALLTSGPAAAGPRRMHESSRIRPATRHRGRRTVCDTGADLGAGYEAAAHAGIARRKVLDERARAVRDAARAHHAERRQPLSFVRTGARDDVPDDEGHGPGSVVRQ